MATTGIGTEKKHGNNPKLTNEAIMSIESARTRISQGIFLTEEEALTRLGL